MSKVKTCYLTEWAVISSTDGSVYSAPELRYMCLTGKVWGHKEHTDGAKIVTSRILASNNRRIETENTIYELVGQPSRDYSEWCAANGIVLNPEDPVRVFA